jgi:hypothetical protein
MEANSIMIIATYILCGLVGTVAIGYLIGAL